MNVKQNATRILFILLLIIILCTSCQTNKSGSSDKLTTELERTAKRNPNDAKAQYDWGRRLLFSNRNYTQAAIAFESALAIDPNYRVTGRTLWTPQIALIFNIIITGNLIFCDNDNDMSLFLYLGGVYYDGSTQNNNKNPDYVFPRDERQNTLEKALDAFRRGYDIDITNGKRDNVNLKIVYLGYIAKILDLLNRQDEANEIYTEVAKIATITDLISRRIGLYFQSIYVSARGNDNNDGLSEARPVNSFLTAFRLTGSGSIKRITVIGTLDGVNDINSGISQILHKANFTLGLRRDYDYDGEIIISGKPDASSIERAVLTTVDAAVNVVYVGFGVKIRFEYIEISGGRDGIYIIEDAQVTLGTGAVVRDNSGIGIAIIGGSCIINGGEVLDNHLHGVGVINEGVLTLSDGIIMNNGGRATSLDGGGVSISNNSRFTMSGGTISNNKNERGGGVSVGAGSRFNQTGGIINDNFATVAGGGVIIFSGGNLTMSGGTISGNRASNYGGGVVVGIGGRFSQGNGIVRDNNAPESPNVARL